MNITKEQLKRIIKEEIENLQENPYAEDNPFDEEDENPLVRAANDALVVAIDKVEELVLAMDEMDDNEKGALYRGTVTMADLDTKMHQLKRLLG